MAAPARASIVSAVKFCVNRRSLGNGTAIHAQILKCGLLAEAILVNHLLNMYVKLNDMSSAERLFDEMHDRNLVSFSALISGYSRSGKPHFAFSLVQELQRNDLHPNQFVFSSLNLVCSKLKLVKPGKQIHGLVITSGYGLDPFVKTSIIDMYSKFEDLDSAASIFYHCLIGDPITYNSMISGFVSCGSYQEALDLFMQARRNIDMRPTEFTFSSVIKAVCYSGKSSGEQMHTLSILTGYDSDCFVGTALVDMYGKFSDMESSLKIYRHILTVDLTLYNAIIGAFAQNGMAESALKFYTQLLIEGYIPNESTFCSILRACTSLKHQQLGRILHGMIEKSDSRRNLVVRTALIDMYMKNGFVEESWRIFRNMPEKNTISYNSMIGGLGQNAKNFEAVKLFSNMNYRSVQADLATFVVLLSSSLGYGKRIFAHAVKHGYGLEPMVQNSLLDCLLKEGAVDDAMEFFEKMLQKSVISWTTIISGLGQLGFNLKAVQLFKRMQVASISPNCFTISCILKACGGLSILELGKSVHGFSIKHGTNADEFTTSSMLDMYANCGALEEAHKLFEKLPYVDVVSCNSMITAHCKHGNASDALMLLDTMEFYGLKPNHVTFISLLSSCSHCGCVEEAIRIFELMTDKYNIIPSMEHYACMVDLYGRIGLLDKAEEVVHNMPMMADVSIWKTILAASRLHGNLELAEIALDHISSIEDHDRVSHVTMSNLYAESGKWDVAEDLRRTMKSHGVLKNPGLSSVYAQA